MIWGCISARGVGNIHFIDGIMVKYVYNDIPKKNVKQSTIKMGMSYVYMFQQENNSKHNAELNRQLELIYLYFPPSLHQTVALSVL